MGEEKWMMEKINKQSIVGLKAELKRTCDSWRRDGQSVRPNMRGHELSEH